LLPVALASFLTSMGTCVIAAIQADLPKKRRRVWSRPLIALLFFLQPIVRDWARYRSAWSERAQPHYKPRALRGPSSQEGAAVVRHDGGLVTKAPVPSDTKGVL